MSQGYSTPVPVDRYGNPQPLTGPTGPALAATSGSQLNSSILVLNTNTTLVQITSQSNPIIGKWFGATATNPSVTASNFDFSVPGNWTNYQVVPQSIIGTGVSGAYGTVNGLYTQLALMPIGGLATSIMTSQY